MFRRLPADTIKNEVHKRVYGQSSTGNDLTKLLIMLFQKEAKKGPIEGFIFQTEEYIDKDVQPMNAPVSVQR